MDKLNDYITTAGQFTQRADAVPPTDHSAQMNYGLGMMQHAAATAAQPPAPAPVAMKPIVPLAN